MQQFSSSLRSSALWQLTAHIPLAFGQWSENHSLIFYLRLIKHHAKRESGISAIF